MVRNYELRAKARLRPGGHDANADIGKTELPGEHLFGATKESRYAIVKHQHYPILATCLAESMENTSGSGAKKGLALDAMIGNGRRG